MAFDGTSAQLYRTRAKELREMAATCHLPEVRDQLNMIAEQFDTLARQVEARIVRL